ncbi:hypothetical protein AXW37_09420 [Yersinia ruckeri]|nr:hypothetical protein UGYR_01160 [Yersinia ruckeri]OIX36875.1 hypothetical protein AXW19_09060 [Yersinia ruckeri]OIX37245.1 hypothetical protein AXW20_09080 [Yersinia ruckeri]OIX37698.1 hypothetical protein AXW18_09080 [Yersinia ruckeri]OIX43326.1 hypothetical protein AXW22_09455 [Yersinia ruckeri]
MFVLIKSILMFHTKRTPRNEIGLLWYVDPLAVYLHFFQRPRHRVSRRAAIGVGNKTRLLIRFHSDMADAVTSFLIDTRTSTCYFISQAQYRFAVVIIAAQSSTKII